MLLALDPGRVLRYTLSPRVTLLFEEARRRAADRPALTIELGWPRDRSVSDPVPFTVEVLADRRRLLSSAAVIWRARGSGSYRRTRFDLGGARALRRVELPPAAPRSQRPLVLEFYLVAYDQRGNEVYRWHDAQRPRELALRFSPRQPWYKRWWVWGIAGAALAGAVGAATAAATWEPGARVQGSGRVVR
jgi:hypothetical protein